MEEIKKESILIKYTDVSELPESDRNLLHQAKLAVENAYAPYSNFNVGCALLLDNGIIVKGNNQENIAYPSGLCAERVAIFSAGANYPNHSILAMAITVKADKFKVTEPIMSCGACLQSMSEYEIRYKQPMRVILQGETGDIHVAEGLKNFMPFMFWTDELKA